MKEIIIYSTDVCPKCRTLKKYLSELGVEYEVKDMAENRPHIDAYNAWPQDNSAPVLEIVDPDLYEEPIFYTHYSLFSFGKLAYGLVAEITGKGDGWSCL